MGRDIDNICPIDFKLKFGVNLPELYPPWYLHPALKNLFYLAQRSAVDILCGQLVDINNLLSYNTNEGTYNDRRTLIEKLKTGSNILNMEVREMVPTWTIRHFLGLLPLPIFYSNLDLGYWINFTTYYFRKFLDDVGNKLSSDYLQAVVVDELASLPAHNITFLIEFFELLNYFAWKSSRVSDIIDRKMAYFLAKFFAPSMFSRPFRPGIMNNKDNKFISFIIYVIYFWKNLQPKIVQRIFENPDKMLKILYYPRDLYHEDLYMNKTRYVTDKSTQTDKHLQNMIKLEQTTNENGELSVLIEVTPNKRKICIRTNARNESRKTHKTRRTKTASVNSNTLNKLILKIPAHRNAPRYKINTKLVPKSKSTKRKATVMNFNSKSNTPKNKKSNRISQFSTNSSSIIELNSPQSKSTENIKNTIQNETIADYFVFKYVT